MTKIVSNKVHTKTKAKLVQLLFFFRFNGKFGSLTSRCRNTALLKQRKLKKVLQSMAKKNLKEKKKQRNCWL